MTIIPKPLQKPLRLCEIILGLLCVATGAWALVILGSWLAFSEPAHGDRLGWNAILLFAQSIYLLGFGANLLRRGYLNVLLWVIAFAILCALPVTMGMVR